MTCLIQLGGREETTKADTTGEKFATCSLTQREKEKDSLQGRVRNQRDITEDVMVYPLTPPLKLNILIILLLRNVGEF